MPPPFFCGDLSSGLSVKKRTVEDAGPYEIDTNRQILLGDT